jgi:hypothetical protein
MISSLPSGMALGGSSLNKWMVISFIYVLLMLVMGGSIFSTTMRNI